MTEEPPANPQRESSPLLRFGCGAILAVVISLSVLIYFSTPTWLAATTILAAAAFGGLLAYRFGDKVLVGMLEMIFYRW